MARPAVAAGERPGSEAEALPWQGSLLELFLRNQMNLAPIMPMLAMLMGLTALNWVPVSIVMSWLVVYSAAIPCSFTFATAISCSRVKLKNKATGSA